MQLVKAARESAQIDNNRMAGRKLVIEKKKEEQERLLLQAEREEEEKRLIQERQTLAAEEERRRLDRFEPSYTFVYVFLEVRADVNLRSTATGIT